MIIAATTEAGLEKTLQAAELLLVFLTKQLTSGKTLGTEQVTSDSFDLLVGLVTKTTTEASKVKIYEGILHLFCRSALEYTAELKSAIAAKILATTAF